MKLPVLLALTVVAGLFAVGWLLLEPGARAGDQTVIGERSAFVAADSSGNGHDGVIVGSPRLGMPGRFGSSYSFGREGSWVFVPSQETNPGAQDFMFSAWVNLARVPGPRESFDVVRKGLSYTRGGEYKLEIVKEGTVRCTIKDSAGSAEKLANDLVDLDDDRWHHLSCARIGDQLILLVDDLVESVPVRLGRVDNSMPLTIGSKYGNDDQVAGRVDEVRLWVSDRVRQPGDLVFPAAAMQELGNQPPLGRWALDES